MPDQRIKRIDGYSTDGKQCVKRRLEATEAHLLVNGFHKCPSLFRGNSTEVDSSGDVRHIVDDIVNGERRPVQDHHSLA